MTKRILLNSAVLSLFLVGSYFANANDSSIGDANGSIEFKNQPNISMDKETLYISEEKIKVDYIFTNTSQHNITVPIAFPMPPMYFGDQDHSSIKDFKIWVDNKPIKTERKLVVLLNAKQDISAKIKALGWNEKSLASFLKREEFTHDKKGLPLEWFDADGWARFTLNEYFIWQQSFPANKSIAIRHSYSPSIASGVPQGANSIIKNYTKTACINKNTQAGIKQRGLEYGVGWANLNYILVTANNWQGPIKDFNLTIKKQYPSDLLSLCFDGEFKKIDATTFTFTQHNFKPKNNLDILFIRKY